MIIINSDARDVLKGKDCHTDDLTCINLDIVLPDGNYVLPEEVTTKPSYIEDLRKLGLPYVVRDLTQTEIDFIKGDPE